MTTGERIKELRLKKGMTQEELAAKTDISVRTIQRIENGEVDPRAYTLQTIATALNIEFEELNKIAKAENEILKDNKTWLAILHLSGLSLLLVPPVIVWLWKKEKVKNMKEHGVDVVNFQLSMLMYMVPLGIFAGFMITIPFLIFLGFFSQVFIVLNTIKAVNGQPYKYPLTFQIIKH